MTSPASRRIEYRPISELQADPRNPKAHHLETIDASVGRFGYVEPIVIDERTGFIVSGHGRTKTLLAMREREESPPEGIQVDESGQWLAPVVMGWSSRTDNEAAAALIALNRAGELGGWVDDSLIDLLDELADSDEGLVGVGFAEDDLNQLNEKLSQIPLDDISDGVSYAERFELVIVCEDENDQEIKYQQLVEAGFTPRALAL